MGLLKHAKIVSECLDSVPRMDEVEVVGRVDPRRFGIVDEEFDVWWKPSGLNGAQVDALHKRGWILLAHLSDVR